MTARDIAHASLSLTEPAYLKHYKRGRFREWNGVSMTASELPGPGFNFAAVLRDNAPSLDELRPVAREFFAGATGWGVLVEGDAGHPMEAELRARGWAVDEDEPAYVLPNLDAVGEKPVPPELKIRKATAQPDTDAYQAVTCAAFRAPPEIADLLIPGPTFVRDPDIALFIGSVNDVDVTAAGCSRGGGTAVLWGVATLDEYRGRGYGEAVSRAALAHAAGRGCVSAALRSGPKSVPVYERIGFRYVCQHRTYAAPAAA